MHRLHNSFNSIFTILIKSNFITLDLIVFYLRKLAIATIVSILIVVSMTTVQLINNWNELDSEVWERILKSSLILFGISTIVVFILEDLIFFSFFKYKYNINLESQENVKQNLPKKIQRVFSKIYKTTLENQLEIKVLEQRENYRKEFIGNISHELKTPLFTVQGYVLTLLDGAHKKKKLTEKYLERTAKGVDRLISIVNELDTITKIESGTLNLDLYPFDIDQLTSKVFELFEMEANKKSITLVLEKNDSDQFCVWADQEKIHQVMVNLIGNSITYGKKEGLTMVSFHQYENQKIQIRVSDDGTGIEQKHLPRLFERFYRVDQTRNRNKGGSGLGLAIVKHIIEAHNQSIDVSSEAGKGTEFTFSLPLYNPLEHQIESDQEQSEQ